MKQFEQNQVALREDMDSVKGNMEEMKDKIDQLTRVIINMMEKEVEDHKRKDASTTVPPLVDKNPMLGFVTDIKHAEVKVVRLATSEGHISLVTHNMKSRPTQID